MIFGKTGDGGQKGQMVEVWLDGVAMQKVWAEARFGDVGYDCRVAMEHDAYAECLVIVSAECRA